MLSVRRPPSFERPAKGREAKRVRKIPASAWRHLLKPHTVAIVGASEKSFYARALRDNLAEHGFTGDLVPVNPGHRTVFGHKCYPSLVGAPEVDVAIMLIPRAQLESAMVDAIQARTRSVVIITNGLRESGDANWVATELRIARMARSAGMPVVGPNSLGFIAMENRAVLFTSPISWSLQQGSTALIMQSGGILSASTWYMTYLGAGLRYAVSIGNASSTGVADWLQILATDGGVQRIGLVVEEVEDWPATRTAVEKAVRAGKWVGVCKLGRSPAGSRVAFTHTGALAGDYDVYRDAFQQIGLREANTVGELLFALSLGERFGRPRVHGVGLMSQSGGTIGHAADLCEARNLPIPALAEQTIADMDREGGLIRPSNPVDLSNQAMGDKESFSRAVSKFLADPALGVGLYVRSGGNPDHSPHHVDLMNRVAQASADQGVPVIATTLTFSIPSQTEQLSRHPSVIVAPIFSDALGGLALWFDERPPDAPKSPISQSIGESQWRNEYEVKAELRRLGLAVPRNRWVSFAKRDQASRNTPIAWPVVVKGLGRTIYHKSRLGLVEIGIDSVGRLRKAVETMTRLAQINGYLLEGFLIEEMVGDGLDLVIGLEAQPIGSVLMLGLGGVGVESRARVRFAVLPVTDTQIARRLNSLGLGDPLQIRRICRVVGRLTALYKAAELRSLECNPVRVLDSGKVIVLDALAVKASTQASN